MPTPKKISLKVVTAPATGIVLDAPPVLKASEHSVDYTCGRCSTILLHAEEGHVRGFLIRCTKCGMIISGLDALESGPGALDAMRVRY
jgi:DNA-directed RNA polymerase subunit RPC12/RpoP